MSSGTLGERGNRHGEHVEAIEQVLAELAARDQLREVGVRRGDDAPAEARDRRRADRAEAPRLEHAQQLGLQRQRQLGDLVEEQRSLAHQREVAVLAAIGAGERAALVAEQLRLHQRLGDRAAVEIQQRLVGVRPLRVDRGDHQLLARAGRTDDQDRPIRERRAPHGLAQELHRPRRADQPHRRRLAGAARAQLAHLALQALARADLRQQRQHQLVAQVVLQDVVVGAEAHRHADLGHLVRRGDDDRQRRGLLADLAHQRQTVAIARVAGQAQVDERDVEALGGDDGARRSPGCRPRAPRRPRCARRC